MEARVRVGELRAAEGEDMCEEEKGVLDCFWYTDDEEEMAGDKDVGKERQESDREDGEDREGESPMEEEEVVKPRTAAQPRLPTSEERRIHKLTHMPFPSWCEYCQRGKSNSKVHRRQQRQKVRKSCDAGLDLPVVSMDYMYLEYTYSRETKSEEEKEAVEKGMRSILVVHDARSSAVFAHDVDRKGLQGSSVKRVMQDLKDLGYSRRDVVLKSNQEPSMRAVIDAVAGQRAENSICEGAQPSRRIASKRCGGERDRSRACKGKSEP